MGGPPPEYILSVTDADRALAKRVVHSSLERWFKPVRIQLMRSSSRTMKYLLGRSTLMQSVCPRGVEDRRGRLCLEPCRCLHCGFDALWIIPMCLHHRVLAGLGYKVISIKQQLEGS